MQKQNLVFINCNSDARKNLGNYMRNIAKKYLVLEVKAKKFGHYKVNVINIINYTVSQKSSHL